MELYKEIVLSLRGILVIFGLGSWRGRRRRPALAENEGEGAVWRWLTKGLAPTQFYLMNNVTLPFEGITAHIDHILLGPTGIFVIETKHYTGGPLFVPPDPHAEWRQQWGRSSYHRDNALSQNARHVRAVRTLLDFVPPQHMHSLVVFTGTAQLPPGHPANVLHLPALIGHIRSYTHTVLTTQDLHLCVGRLEWTRRRISRQTDVEHVQNLNRRFGTID